MENEELECLIDEAEFVKEIVPEQEDTSQFIANKLGVHLESEKALEEKINSYHRWQSDQVADYLKASNDAPEVVDHLLSVLNGWMTDRKKSDLPGIIQVDKLAENCGGYFIRWNGKGIAINPGPRFLDLFHREGFFIKDIDFVIVTKDTPDAWGDIKRIYELNNRLNRVNPELQVIQYYLNQKAYRDLSHVLKPNFKQERNSVHSLEIFMDSPDVEKEELGHGITMNYFSPSSQTGYRDPRSASLGIRLDLSTSAGKGMRIGYLTGTSWSPLLSHHMGECDLLLAGFGNTNSSDYGKLDYNERSLGYFGTFTLLEELTPKILLSSEYGGRDGDIRVEITKKLRHEYSQRDGKETVILPADCGLKVDLINLKIACSVTEEFIAPSEVQIVKLAKNFGRLKYLSKNILV